MFSSLFSGIEIPFRGKEKGGLCVRLCSTQTNKTVECAFVKEIAKNAPNLT